MRCGTMIVIAVVLAGLFAIAARGQAPLGTSMTYQGELARGGSPVTDGYDLRFSLRDAAAGGTQIGGTLCADNLSINNGRFSVILDFGPVIVGQS